MLNMVVSGGLRRAGLLATVAACVVVTLAGPAVAAQNAPTPTPTADYIATLDKLLAQHKYAELRDTLINVKTQDGMNGSLDWSKAKMYSGAPLMIAIGYAINLWRIGVAQAVSKPVEDFREAAGFVMLYILATALVDSPKCGDSTAPGARMEQILTGYGEFFRFLQGLPADRRNLAVDTALAMERYTAPRRGNDDILCSGGMAEHTYYMKKNPVKEMPPQPDQPGNMKTFAIQNDGTYQIEFVDKAIWEPKQAALRAQAAAELHELVNSPAAAPNIQVPAQPKPVSPPVKPAQ